MIIHSNTKSHVRNPPGNVYESNDSITNPLTIVCNNFIILSLTIIKNNHFYHYH